MKKVSERLREVEGKVCYEYVASLVTLSTRRLKAKEIKEHYKGLTSRLSEKEVERLSKSQTKDIGDFNTKGEK